MLPARHAIHAQFARHATARRQQRRAALPLLFAMQIRGMVRAAQTSIASARTALQHGARAAGVVHVA